MPSHRTAAVISIGDELVLGQTLDTNTRWLASRLTDLGVRVVEHATVEDDAQRLAALFARLSAEVDLLLTTGGLGPTADDLTRTALAAFLNERLVTDEASLAEIRAWFEGRGRTMPETNSVQALRPESARSLTNPNGTAPGLLATDPRGVLIACMPGPPHEMQPMFEASVLPEIRPPDDRTIVTRVLHTFGYGESEVASRLGELMARTASPSVGTTASTGVVSVRIRHECEYPRERAEGEVESLCETIRDRLGYAIFAEGTRTLDEMVVRILRERRDTLAVVESCTGGMLGQMLTLSPGASDVFVGGWITYSNEQKTKMVGVSFETLEAHGAVSRQCCHEMAAGGLERSDADHCLAITGVAGPGGGTDEKPVGMVWIGLASRGMKPDIRCFRFKGPRDIVRLWSARTAMAMLRLRMINTTMKLLGEDPDAR
ncbi:MAG: competence/damage-inducible protein A [Phycisphaerales bacterium]|nr:MAG: competence/damage-inducible protein A [Phycisphaerales bacterium]